MEHNPKVEGIAKSIATLILILGIISGVVLIIIGFANDYGATEILITGGIVDIISSIVFWVFVNLLVNISLKLDKRDTSISNQSIREITELLRPKSENKSQLKDAKTNPVTAELPKYDEAKVPSEQKSTEEDELENIVLGEILTDNITAAKQILMTKMRMTQSQAAEYIERIKSDTNL